MKFRELVERMLRLYPEAEQQAVPGTIGVNAKDSN